jgi:mono/diheme cytochrome c family protein
MRGKHLALATALLAACLACGAWGCGGAQTPTTTPSSSDPNAPGTPGAPFPQLASTSSNSTPAPTSSEDAGAAEPAQDPQVAAGEALFYKKACSTCHSIDGSASTGPTFKNLWGKTEKMNDGTTEVIDQRMVKLSLLQPHMKIVDGYASPSKMPTYDLADPEIDQLVAFMKSLAGGN